MPAHILKKLKEKEKKKLFFSRAPTYLRRATGKIEKNKNGKYFFLCRILKYFYIKAKKIVTKIKHIFF